MIQVFSTLKVELPAYQRRAVTSYWTSLPSLPHWYTTASSLTPSQHLALLNRPSSAYTPNPDPAVACQGLHTVPLSWAGQQLYSKSVDLQQSQQPLYPTFDAAERHPRTGIHAPSFLGRRREAPGIPVEAVPRLPGHRMHQKEDKVPKLLRNHSTLIHCCPLADPRPQPVHLFTSLASIY